MVRLATSGPVFFLCAIAFRLLRVHEAIRGELPVCPTDSIHYALIPALTPPQFPIVIVVKISFPPIMQVGAIFCSEQVSRLACFANWVLQISACMKGMSPVHATRMEFLSVIIPSL